MATTSGQFAVATPVGEPPLRRFVGRLPFTLATGAGGDRPRLDPQGCRLRASVSTYDYDALDAGTLTADVASAGVQDGRRRLIVTLDAPRRVRRLFTTTSAGARLDLHRVDGTTFSVEPTTHASRFLATTYGVAGEFVDGRFGVEGPLELDLAGVGVRSMPAGVAFTVVAAGTPDEVAVAAPSLWRPPAPDVTSVDLSTEVATAMQAVVDDHATPLPDPIELSLVVVGDTPFRAHVLELTLLHDLVDHGFAALPLTRSDTTDPVELAAVLRVPRDPLAVHLRGLLTTASRRALDHPDGGDVVDRLLDELSDSLAQQPVYDPVRFAHVDVPPGLVQAAASNPTGERLVRVNRRLLEVALPDLVRPRTEPRLLDAGTRPTVLVRRLPSGTLDDAGIEVTVDADVARPLDDAAADVPPEQVGSEVDAAGWVAASVQPGSAVSAAGVEVRLVAATTATEVQLEVRVDHAGLPTGQVVAAGTTTVAVGRPTWARVDFAEPVVLSTAAYWVALRAGLGRAVWLAVPGGPARWARRGGDDDWIGWVADGLSARVRLVTDVEVPETVPAVAIEVDGQVSSGQDGEDAVRHDLVDALGAEAAGVPVVATIAATGSGSVTIEPPVLTYRPP